MLHVMMIGVEEGKEERWGRGRCSFFICSLDFSAATLENLFRFNLAAVSYTMFLWLKADASYTCIKRLRLSLVVLFKQYDDLFILFCSQSGILLKDSMLCA